MKKLFISLAIVVLVVAGFLIWRIFTQRQTASDIATITAINVDYLLNSYTKNLVFEEKGEGLVGVGSTKITDYIKIRYPNAEYACESTLYFLHILNKDNVLSNESEELGYKESQITTGMEEGVIIEMGDGNAYLIAEAGQEPCEIYTGSAALEDNELTNLMNEERTQGMLKLTDAIKQAQQPL